MIGYLSGTVFSRSASEIIITIGGPSSIGAINDSNGKIGYQLLIPDHTRYLDFEVGNQVSVHVYTHVREDSLDLYGFKSQLEKNVFLALIGVNKIGPKLGLTLLTYLSTEEIISGILKGDVDRFVKVSGVGKKTGERIVLELQDQIQKKLDSGKWKLDVPLESGNSRSSRSIETQSPSSKNLSHLVGMTGAKAQLVSEARSALVSLGYKEQLVNQVLTDFVNSNEEDFSQFTTEQMVRNSLKELSRR